MVSLNARFTVFSSLCALAITSVDAIAIPPLASISSRHSSPDAKGPTRVQTPVIHLPGKGKKKSKESKEKSSKHHKERRTYGDYMNPVQRIGDIIADGLSIHGNPLLDRFVPDGQQKHFQVPRHHKDKDSHTHTHTHVHGREQRNEHAAADFQKRSGEGVPGTVDIMSPTAGGGDWKRIASLFLDLDESSGSPVYSFSASDTNSTELTLVPDSDSDSSNENLTIVSLHIPMFDRSSTLEVHYCITYDRNPPEPEPLGLAECTNGTLANSLKSQSFAYNATSGTIQPMWFSDEGEQQDMSNNTTSSSGASNTASVSSRDVPAQDMTLVFRSTEPMAPAPLHAESADPEPTVVTMTKTETSTVTVTSTMESASAVGPTVGALSVSSAASSSSSTASSATMTASSPPMGALAVEVVHSTTASATSSSVPASTDTASAPSINAEAIASIIAGSVPTDLVPGSGSSASPSASSTGSVSSSSGAPSMTPVTTPPYNWKFKRSSEM